MDAMEADTRLRTGFSAAWPPPAPRVQQNLRMEPDDAAAAPDRPDATTLEGTYAQLRGGLLAFLRKHTGDAHVAEDLLHDVVLKALAACSDGASAPRNLTGWLYAVARNAAMDHHRRNRPTEDIAEELAASDVDDGEAAIADLANCLRPVAEQLPDTYRETLIAAEFDGLTLAEVAQRLGLSLSAVKTRASRGRRLLQQQLVECCRVALSANGQVVDYDVNRVAACAPPQPDAPCGRRCAKAH